MPYLLDTPALSEPKQKKPHPKVVEFLRELTLAEMFVSVISFAEIWKGIELLVPGKKRSDLEQWCTQDLLVQFGAQTLPIDLAIARDYGTLAATLIRKGLTISISDGLIAATARVHDLAVVTRNESDFQHCGVKILNPWK